MDAGKGSGDSMSPGDRKQGNGGIVQRHGQGGLCGGNCGWCVQGHGA